MRPATRQQFAVKVHMSYVSKYVCGVAIQASASGQKSQRTTSGHIYRIVLHGDTTPRQCTRHKQREHDSPTTPSICCNMHISTQGHSDLATESVYMAPLAVDNIIVYTTVPRIRFSIHAHAPVSTCYYCSEILQAAEACCQGRPSLHGLYIRFNPLRIRVA